jgi:hypothetical protein
VREYIFDDKGSIVHSILGMITPIIAQKMLLLALFLILAFTVYESVEPENPISTIGDFTEFIIGFLLGLLISLYSP